MPQLQQYFTSTMRSNEEVLALYQQALGLHKQGRFSLAEHHYLTLLSAIPQFAQAHLNLGVLYFQQENYSAALNCFIEASRHDPTLAEAFFYAGNAMRLMGQTENAIAWYDKALVVNPDYADAHYNLGNLYRSMGRIASAIRHYRVAVQQQPVFDMAWNNLGICQLEMGHLNDAFDCFSNAQTSNSNNVEALYNLGLCCKLQGRSEDALEYVHRALTLDSEHGPSLALQVSLLQQYCSWSPLTVANAKLEAITQRQLAQGRQPAESPFLSFTRSQDPLRNLAIAQAWSHQVAKKYGAIQHQLKRQGQIAIDHGRRITIGYLSERFRNAATAHLTAGLFGTHHRDQFRIIAYSLGKDDGSVYRQRIVSGVDQFVDIRHMSVLEAAERIRADGVDILVDLMGWMHGHRIGILALRPAPIQVTYLGFPGTTGAAFIDYILADKIVIPPSHRSFYSEKVVYLPHCYQATDPHPPAFDGEITREMCALPHNRFVFASFNTDYKIEAHLFVVWMDILRSVENSVLWLLVRTDTAKDNLRRSAVEAGISQDRLIFAPAWPKDRHLDRLGLADVALDTWTVNGHTTTSDALWSGVPVITRIGGHFASRVAASVLNAMGLSMLITHSAQEYAQLAITLAKEPKVLRHLRAQLKTNRIRCPLFDTQRFVKNLESAYLTMWQRHQAGRAPDSFDVVDNATKQAQIHVPKCGTCFCDSTDNQEWRRGK